MELVNAFELGLYLQYIKTLRDFNIREIEVNTVIDSIIRIRTIFENEQIGLFYIPELKNIEYYLRDKYDEENLLLIDDHDKILRLFDEIIRNIYDELSFKQDKDTDKRAGVNIVELNNIINENPSEFIDYEIWLSLKDDLKKNIKESANNLLLGNYSSSAILALRSSEIMIREYYKLTNNMASDKFALGKIIRDIELSISKQNTGLINNIKLINEKRNQAYHSNKIYSSRDTTIIFLEVMSIIEELQKLILEDKKIDKLSVLTESQVIYTIANIFEDHGYKLFIQPRIIGNSYLTINPDILMIKNDKLYLIEIKNYKTNKLVDINVGLQINNYYDNLIDSNFVKENKIKDITPILLLVNGKSSNSLSLFAKDKGIRISKISDDALLKESKLTIIKKIIGE